MAVCGALLAVAVRAGRSSYRLRVLQLTASLQPTEVAVAVALVMTSSVRLVAMGDWELNPPKEVRVEVILVLTEAREARGPAQAVMASLTMEMAVTLAPVAAAAGGS